MKYYFPEKRTGARGAPTNVVNEVLFSGKEGYRTLGRGTLGRGTLGRERKTRVDSRSGDLHRVDSRSGALIACYCYAD